jgi:hypothetical protein
MNGPDRIKISASIDDPFERVAFIVDTLDKLKTN